MSRPTVMTSETVSKLEEAFSWGCTDEEACCFAGIAMSTLYKHQDENSEFSERKRILKTKPVLLARQAVIENFRRNPAVAFKYLERKAAIEFYPDKYTLESLG